MYARHTIQTPSCPAATLSSICASQPHTPHSTLTWRRHVSVCRPLPLPHSFLTPYPTPTPTPVHPLPHPHPSLHARVITGHRERCHTASDRPGVRAVAAFGRNCCCASRCPCSRLIGRQHRHALRPRGKQRRRQRDRRRRPWRGGRGGRGGPGSACRRVGASRGERRLGGAVGPAGRARCAARA
eukprot:115312-Chlamydomonas_euryale.AAC.1